MTKSVQIDASSHCQLACPSCPTADGSTRPTLGAGHLSLADFTALLEANPAIEDVELSNYGEMFLNPALPEILRAAFESGVVLHADNGANLNLLRAEALDALIRYRFRSLTVSIDGASPEAYAQYRRKGDFDRVIDNIRRINEEKRRHRTGFPILAWQFIVFGHNEHESAAARKLAAELGMGFRAKLSWDDGVSPIQNRELVQLALRTPHVTRSDHYAATGAAYLRSFCYQLWRAPVLNWDGRVTGCCRNFWGDFGVNAFEAGLEPALASERFQYAEQLEMGRAEPRPDIPCATCELYKTMQSDGRWISREEIPAPSSQILLSVFVDPGASEATHADLFLYPGHKPNRIALAEPPPSFRFEVGKGFSALLKKTNPNNKTQCALPKRMDPDFRKRY